MCKCVPKRRIGIVVVMMLFCLMTAKAQDIVGVRHNSGNHPSVDTLESITEKFTIYYKCDSILINPTYLGNKENIAHIRNYLQNSPRIDSITIYAWASPEGGYKHNLWLSRERAKTAKNFLLSHSDSLKLNADKIKISPLAENWQGLEQLVVENYTRHDRDKVLKILRADNIGDETRKWRLQQLDGGYTWKYLIRKYMPELRNATWICVWAEAVPPLQHLPVPELPEREPEKLSRIMPEPPVGKRTILGLKTNLLFDAVTALNFAVEVPINESWSVL